jgi:tetratricopeptide (TPR) repeat protein
MRVAIQFLLLVLASGGWLSAAEAEVPAKPQRPAPKFTPAQLEKQVLQLLSDGKQSEAERLIFENVSAHRDNQDVVFLCAAAVRSRFMVREAFPIFDKVADMDKDTPRGKCAALMLRLDRRRDVEENFAAFKRLVEANPDDIVMRWMIAVQCRTHEKNQEGVKHYKKILEKWNPGPSLVHQTYGNLLDDLNQYDEALVERHKTVKLEPAGWSYQGLGNTLTHMNRFDEASEAFQKATDLDPENAAYWRCWASSLLEARKFAEAIPKCEKVVELDPEDAMGWAYWGRCLHLTGNKQAAREKYQKAIKLDRACEYARTRLAALEKEMEKESSPHKN